MKSGRLLKFLNDSQYDILLLAFHHGSCFVLNVKFIPPCLNFCQKIGMYDKVEW
jgi:hypothetical protein